jgi:hypothetical protein
VKGEIPELKAAALRTVVPLPANSLVYDPLAPVTIDHLGNVASLVEWHQRQLSLAAPLCGDTEADLLLVLAAATHALELPSSEIKKSRAKVFAWQVRTGKYTLALRYVPQARISLDRLAAARGAYWLAVPIPATEGSR